MGDDPGKKKLSWSGKMQIGKLKPGARETLTDKKLATFTVGKQKKSRLQKASHQQQVLTLALERSKVTTIIGAGSGQISRVLWWIIFVDMFEPGEGGVHVSTYTCIDTTCAVDTQCVLLLSVLHYCTRSCCVRGTL